MVDVVGCKMCLHVLIPFEFNIQAELHEVGKKKIFPYAATLQKLIFL